MYLGNYLPFSKKCTVEPIIHHFVHKLQCDFHHNELVCSLEKIILCITVQTIYDMCSSMAHI
jgi:hypothetical protein